MCWINPSEIVEGLKARQNFQYGPATRFNFSIVRMPGYFLAVGTAYENWPRPQRSVAVNTEVENGGKADSAY